MCILSCKIGIDRFMALSGRLGIEERLGEVGRQEWRERACQREQIKNKNKNKKG